MHSKSIVNAVVFIALAWQPILAQTPTQILEQVRANFKGITSLQAETDTSTVAELTLDPSGNGKPITSVFKYWEKGDCFRYDLNNTTPDKEKLIATQAYNSDSYQYFTMDKGGLLQISKKPLPKLWLNLNNALFQTYSFLYLDQDSKPGYIAPMPSLTDVANVNLWDTISENAKILNITNPSADVVAVSFTLTCLNKTTHVNDQFIYNVSFSKKYQYFPISFQKLNKNRVLVADCSCDVVGEIKDPNTQATFFYPKSLIYKGYADDGKLLFTSHSSVSSVELNTVNDDGIFTIDPGSARLILDRDKNVFVTVPQ